MREDFQLLLKYFSAKVLSIWRLAIPLWLFRDAGGGTVEQRIANYRYNRAQRRILPFYVWKWIGIALCTLQLTRLLSQQMQGATQDTGHHLCTLLACMSAGIGFAFSCVVIIVLFGSYLFLSLVER